MVDRSSKKPNWAKYVIDAKTFQQPLSALATTIALKVQREGNSLLPKPDFVVVDIYAMLRQAHHTYNLFFFLNADERRQKDVNWKLPYSIVILPLVRCMIDCLYNITAILQQPGPKGYAYRLSGFKKAFQSLEADEKRYAGDPEWDESNAKFRAQLVQMAEFHSFTMGEINDASIWPTLTRYLKEGNGLTNPSPHQEFLQKLTLGFWDEYAGMGHGTFQGLMATATAYMQEELPHELRPNVDEVGERLISKTIFRVAGILLCMLTEVQAYFRFDGAHINQRLHRVWNALLPVFEIKELYDGRYDRLMRDKGIGPD